MSFSSSGNREREERRLELVRQRIVASVFKGGGHSWTATFDAALKSCDLDGNGVLDFSEYTQLLRKLKVTRASVSDDSARHVFHKMDTSGDGFLSATEARGIVLPCATVVVGDSGSSVPTRLLLGAVGEGVRVREITGRGDGAETASPLGDRETSRAWDRGQRCHGHRGGGGSTGSSAPARPPVALRVRVLIRGFTNRVVCQCGGRSFDAKHRFAMPFRERRATSTARAHHRRALTTRHRRHGTISGPRVLEARPWRRGRRHR